MQGSAMNIHLGFWIVRAAIALAVISLFIHFYNKVKGKLQTILALIGLGIFFWGAYSLLALVM
jgi:hypothetical protein